MNTLTKMSGRGLMALLVVLLLVLGLHLTVQGSTSIRPIEDFISQQGKSGGPNPRPGYEGFPTFIYNDPNFFGMQTILPPASDSPFAERGWAKKSDVVLFAGVDYAGLGWEAYAPYTSTPSPTFSGTIIERPLPDGRAEVTVLLHTKGANIWVIQIDPTKDLVPQNDTNPTLFGYRPRDVATNGQALADCLLHVVFINTAPGAPLPDLEDFYFFPNPDQELKFLAFSSQAQGPLTAEFGVPKGTPGKCTIVQTGLIDVFVKQYGLKGKASENSRGAYDVFPVENIDLKVIGK